MTMQRWIAVVAMSALAFGAEREWRRWKGQQRAPGYRLASTIINERDAQRMPSQRRTDDPMLLVALTTAALVGTCLRRRRRNPRTV
jgi:hypothetical protein